MLTLFKLPFGEELVQLRDTEASSLAHCIWRIFREVEDGTREQKKLKAAKTTKKQRVKECQGKEKRNDSIK